MPFEHNGRQDDHPPQGLAGSEEWMELDVDEGGFAPVPGGMFGTMHNWTGTYPNYTNVHKSRHSSEQLDRTELHTFGASYDPKMQAVAWWLDDSKIGDGAVTEGVPEVAAQQHFYLILSCQSHSPSWKQTNTGIDYGMLARYTLHCT